MKRPRPFTAYRKVYSWSIKYVVFSFLCALFGLCSVYIYFFYTQSPVDDILLDEPQKVTKMSEKPHFEGKKYVHLDLKGAPPKLPYFEYLFTLLESVGVNGVIMEYEDMFPYEGQLKNISALNAYTRNDIKLINMIAKRSGLEVVPLVQTFGHLEFILKLEEFEGLREVPEFPQTICPSSQTSMELLSNMLSQVIEAHPESNIIHIGADETYFIGRCRQCHERMKQENITKEGLYLKHIRKICDLIINKYPHMSILMWDDQLRYLSEDEIKYGMNRSYVTPVVWQYQSDVFDKLGPSLWNQYSKLFQTVWIASAFKGATGVDQYIINMSHYIQNHRSWMNIVENYKYLLKFDAIILTGWQRYDHFSILCELLPVALPSLIMNLKLLDSIGDDRLGPPKEVADLLNCRQPYALMGTSFGTPGCSYLGSGILENVYRLHQLNEDYDKLIDNPIVRGWMNELNSHYKFSSPNRIYMISSQLDHFKIEIQEIEESVAEALLEVYDVHTKDEWIYTYVKPLQKKIADLLNARDEILSMKIWPRRPFL